jgi:hypothetical protein
MIIIFLLQILKRQDAQKQRPKERFGYIPFSETEKKVAQNYG